MKLYTGDLKTNEKLRLVVEASEGRTLLIDKFGQSVPIDTMRSVEQIEELISDNQAYQRGVSDEFLKNIKGLPDTEIFKTMQAAIQALPYEPFIDFFYHEVFPYNKADTSVTYRASLTVCIKDSDWVILNPLRELPWFRANVIEEKIAMVELPEGEHCCDCSTELKLPYHYYFISKVHRCIPCAERQNVGEPEKLLRYPVLENSVLVFSQRHIVAERLGKNMQPRQERECKPHDYSCNGCGKGKGVDEPRYACLGCREDNSWKKIDFCPTCVKTMLENQPQAESKLLKPIREYNKTHSIDHPLLRILYCPRSYRET